MNIRYFLFLLAGLLAGSGFAELTAKCYVLDGLIAHWDGVFNAGYHEEHQADAAKWKELTGKGPDIANPQGSSFAANALTTVREYGSPVSKYPEGGSGYDAVAILAAMKDARYTVEIAYDKTKATLASSTGNKKMTCKMLILGHEQLWFGTSDDAGCPRIGFCPNDSNGGSESALKKYVDVESTSGKHTFSCVQNRNEVRVDVDGRYRNTWTIGTLDENPKTAHLFKFNRAYWSNVGLDGNYHSIRIYNRALSADEVAVNRAVDQVRFFGADASKISLPQGWRFKTEGGVSLERVCGVSAECGGSVEVSADNLEDGALWVNKAGGTRVAVRALPDTGYEFAYWKRGIDIADAAKNTGALLTTGEDIVAVFRRIHFDGLYDGLVYDLNLSLAGEHVGEAALPAMIYNSMANSASAGRQTAVAVGAQYTGADREHIPAQPYITKEQTVLPVGTSLDSTCIRLPQPTYTNAEGTAIMSVRGGVRLCDDCVDGDATVHVRFRWDGPMGNAGNIAGIPIFANGFNKTGNEGFLVGLYGIKGNFSKGFLSFGFGGDVISHGGGITHGQVRDAYNIFFGRWYDLVLSLFRVGDGTTAYTFHLGYLDGGTRQKFTFTGIVSNDCLAASSLTRYMALGTTFAQGAGDAGWNETATGSVSDLNAFRGSIAKLKVWNRKLSQEEVCALFANADGNRWTIGAPDGTGDEFGSGDLPSAYDPETMPWRDFPRELTAERPAAVVKGRFQPDLYDDEKLVKFLLLEPVAAELPENAQLRVSVNGAVAAEVDLARPGERVVYLRKWLMKPDPDGMLAIELRRTGSLAGRLTFDRIVLGGGMQAGVHSGKNSANEFGGVWTRVGQFTFGDTNTQHCMAYLMPRTYNANVSKLSVAFDIPSAVFGECRPKLESRIRNQKGISPPAVYGFAQRSRRVSDGWACHFVRV